MVNRKIHSALYLAITELGKWRQAEERRLKNDHAMLRRKTTEVEQQISDLQAELEKLKHSIIDNTEESQNLSSVEHKRGNLAILQGLTSGRSVLEERDEAYQAVVTERMAAVAIMLKNPKISETVAEFEQFHTVEGTLSALPESYRAAILKHHAQVRENLSPIFNTLDAPLPQQEVPPTVVAVVACLEPNPDVPDRFQALSIILPVSAEVNSSWALGHEAIGHRLAYRWIAALSFALNSLGAGNAPIRYDQYADCLSIDIWLNDCELLGDIKVAVGNAFEKWTSSNELNVVQCSQELIWVTPDYISQEEN